MEPWEYTWIEFDGLRAQESLRLAGISGKEPIYSSASPEAGEKLKQQMLFIVNNGAADPIRLIGHAFLFLAQLAESSAYRDTQNTRRLRDFYIREALAFIEGNFQRDITIEEIAAFCGLNRSYFGKVFRETMGESPQAFLLHYRMARAAQLLKETRLSVGEIAQQVSYDNQLHFSRAFKMFTVFPHGSTGKRILLRLPLRITDRFLLICRLAKVLNHMYLRKTYPGSSV